MNNVDQIGDRILKTVLIFVVINAALWVGQAIYYRGDTIKINEMETYLDNEKIVIDTLNKKIDLQSAQLETQMSLVNDYELKGQIAKYNQSVNTYNELLETYKADLKNYDEKLDGYNQKVEEVNMLIQNSGSRWYLIPIPLPGKSSRSKIQ